MSTNPTLVDLHLSHARSHLTDVRALAPLWWDGDHLEGPKQDPCPLGTGPEHDLNCQLVFGIGKTSWHCMYCGKAHSL